MKLASVSGQNKTPDCRQFVTACRLQLHRLLHTLTAHTVQKQDTPCTDTHTHTHLRANRDLPDAQCPSKTANLNRTIFIIVRERTHFRTHSAVLTVPSWCAAPPMTTCFTRTIFLEADRSRSIPMPATRSYVRELVGDGLLSVLHKKHTRLQQCLELNRARARLCVSECSCF